MLRICAAVIIVVILVGCDSGLEPENIKLRSENVKLSQQVAKLQAKIDKLQYQIEQLKKSAPNLFAEAANLESKKTYTGYKKAKEKFNELILIYPTSAEAKAAKSRIKSIDKKMADIDRKIVDKRQKVIDSTSKNSKSKTRTRSGTLKILRGTDDGYTWRKATDEVRIDLCKDIAKRIGKYNWQHYYDNIKTFYGTEEAGILRMKIAEAAGMVSVLPSASQQERALSQARESGKVSTRDREIYAYLQKRWDFYESRDGRYIPEQHDSLVISEGASKFGLTNAEITSIFKKVDRIRWGTE